MGSVEVQLSATPEAARAARVAIRSHFADSLPAPTLYDVLTIVTELVANGVRHGEGGPIRMRVSVAADGAIRGEVENAGHGKVAPREIDATGQSGIGLHIVDAIALHWNAVAKAGTTLVRFELPSA